MSMLRMTNLVSATERKLIASLRLAFETEVAISAAKIDEYKAKNPELADAIQTLNDELTKKHLLNLPASVLLAVEEAADFIRVARE